MGTFSSVEAGDPRTKQLLPKVEVTRAGYAKEEWGPAVRISKTVPFGYKEHPTDKRLFLPVPEELDALERAKVFLREYSLRDVADWLTKETGRYISHMGLSKRVKQDKLRRKRGATLAYYVGLYKEAIEAAIKVEQEIGARGITDGFDGTEYDQLIEALAKESTSES